jgi:hypothetical protein
MDAAGILCRRPTLGGAYVVGSKVSTRAVEINLKDALGGVQDQTAVLTLFEMFAESFDNLSRKSAFQVIANGTNCCPASHRSPQGLALHKSGASGLPTLATVGVL